MPEEEQSKPVFEIEQPDIRIDYDAIRRAKAAHEREQQAERWARQVLRVWQAWEREREAMLTASLIADETSQDDELPPFDLESLPPEVRYAASHPGDTLAAMLPLRVRIAVALLRKAKGQL